MGRVKRPFKRPENKRDAKLIIIATEGRKTERIYFEALAEKYENTKVHVNVLDKLNDKSSPKDVLEQLKEFEKEYLLDSDDELWMVIDRDSWKEQMISDIARSCSQKINFYLCVSNPAFELWLILHFENVNTLYENIKIQLFENKRVSRNKTYSKRYITNILGGFNESKYDPSPFMSKVNDAINNSITLDIHPKRRWPDYLGTRVYKVVKSIIS